MQGGILIDKGIIKAIGSVARLESYSIDRARLTEVDAQGAWVTPGLVDLHSHLGVESVPSLSGEGPF